MTTQMCQQDHCGKGTSTYLHLPAKYTLVVYLARGGGVQVPELFSHCTKFICPGKV